MHRLEPTQSSITLSHDNDETHSQGQYTTYTIVKQQLYPTRCSSLNERVFEFQAKAVSLELASKIKLKPLTSVPISIP